MTSYQRMDAALRGERCDTTPVFLRDLTLGLDVCDYTTPEVCAGGYHPGKSARCIIETQRLLGHDCVVGGVHDLGLDVERFGGRVEFPERGIPFVAQPAFASAREIPDPGALAAAPPGRLPGLLRSYQLVREQLGRQVAIAANVEGPVTKAGLLRGLDALLVDMMRDPPAARAAVDLAVEVCCEHVRLLRDAGADFIFIAAASDGPAAIRPDHYLEYTVPGLARIVSAAAAREAPVVFHPHGPFTDCRFHHLVDAAVETGIVGFQFGEKNDLGLARRRWGGRICVLGGVDIAEVLRPGPPARIREITCSLVADAGANGGFVLMPSCSVHRGFPLAHLQAMVDAARAGGREARHGA
jgi:MtaA/CmuA family methyltransferase